MRPAAAMTSTRRATNTKLQQAETLFLQGTDIATVARRLKTSVRNVKRYVAVLKRTGRLSHQILKRGRPRRLSLRTERALAKEALEGESSTQGELVHFLEDFHSVRCSKSTIRRALRRHKIRSYKKKKRPYLKAHHMRARLAFATEHRQWTADQWSKVLWSDESRCSVWGNDGTQHTFRKQKACLRERDVQPTVKHGGGGVMVWGCFTAKGVGRLVRLVGKVDTDKYLRICGPSIIESILELGLTFEEVTFQQDNASCNVSARALAWFQEGGLRLMRWPAQSPDLNPKEHLWSNLKRRVEEHPKPANCDALWEIIEGEWENTDPAYCQRLVESMPRRLEAVIKAKGGYTTY